MESHSWSHPLLTTAQTKVFSKNFCAPRQEIEQRLGKQVEALGVPGAGGLTSLTGRKARWISACFVSDPWQAPRELGGVELSGRLTIKNQMRAGHLESLIKEKGSYPQLFHAQYRAKEFFPSYRGRQHVQTGLVLPSNRRLLRIV